MYAEHIQGSADLLAQFKEAEIDNKKRRATCAFMRERKKKGPLNPVRFDDKC